MRSPGLFWLSVAMVVIGLLGVAWLSVAIPPIRGDDFARRGRVPDLELGDDSEDRDSPNEDGGTAPETDDARLPSNLGERIFRTGDGEDGPIPRTAVGPGMMGGGCADCHGSDGRGRNIRFMMGDLKTPDIRLSTLLQPHGDGEEAWTREEVATAIRDGVEPDGSRLDEFMPRWRMSDAEMDALLDYMEELNGS